MWFYEGFFRTSVCIILVLTILALLYYISPIFTPLLWFLAAILLPLLFSTFFYYALRPTVDWLNRWMPRYLAIMTVYVVLAVIGATLVLVAGPKVATEISKIMAISPEKIENIKESTSDVMGKIQEHIPWINFTNIETLIFNNIHKINTIIYQLSVNMVSTLASIAIALALTPFVLFYFLRDGTLLSRFVLRYTPNEFQDEVQTILQDIDSTLSEFILAQMTVAGVVGLFLFLGYWLIGLPQALSLALFAMIFYVIPVLGTFIAIIPALLVAISTSFLMTIKVIVVMVIAHVLEADIITPRFLSQRLKIHPLTIILLLLSAGTLYGLLGLLLVTPTYAILKVIIWNIYKISRLRYAEAKQKAKMKEEESKMEG